MSWQLEDDWVGKVTLGRGNTILGGSEDWVKQCFNLGSRRSDGESRSNQCD